MARNLPIEHDEYSRFTAKEIVAALPGLDGTTLSYIDAMEWSGKGRVTVLRQVARMQAGLGSEPTLASDVPHQVAGLLGDSRGADGAGGAGLLEDGGSASIVADEAVANDDGPTTQQRMDVLEAVVAYQDAKSRTMRRAVGWGVFAVVALVLSLVSYSDATNAAANGQSQSYFVWWGPVVFGGWRALQNAIAAVRLDRAAHALTRQLLAQGKSELGGVLNSFA